MSDDTIRRSDAIKAFTVNSKGERLSYVDCDNFPIEFSLEYIVKTIIALPTADRPQGEWIKKPHKVYLPRDYEPDIIDYRDRQYNEEDHSIIQYWWHCNQCDYEASRWAKPTANFCPDCGTRMKGADDE